MSSATITIPTAMLLAMQAHLFPGNSNMEQGGFLLCKSCAQELPYSLVVEEWLPLMRDDYVTQASDYLELSDAARARIIKLAHERNAILLEVHCHPSKQPACFSPADILGLVEFVPHIRWRLRGKPYAALVVGHNSIDGLAWFGDSKTPIPIGHIYSGSQIQKTTLLSSKIYGDVRYG
ncbi:hypothetical protein Q4S45_20605 [Massilia sp. R2A-15]|uniref:hypothetical protein n=1 Tax=Massilia sp. R2A-15 TaxID=3064278 RepID=UPI002733E972|nr:hypothetical protein [Massilia sp. R2A-15]WLI89075.1 hypothetical protein Q4S45_20605 [Massilia sp. R2A-15]